MNRICIATKYTYFLLTSFIACSIKSPLELCPFIKCTNGGIHLNKSLVLLLVLQDVSYYLFLNWI